jgi:1,2-diacylglycerol-3-alpha-glucose alpha-1,2-galactosyltransferase
MKVHLASESAFHTKGNGVHTAFLEMVDLLKEQNDIEVVVNNDGFGSIFHCHTYGPYYFLKGMRYKGKRIHSVHVIPDSIKGSIPNWEFYMPLAKWYFKKVFSYADVCIAISPTVEKVIKDMGINTRVEIINNPVIIEKWKRTPEMRNEGRRMLGLSDSDFVVLGVGQLEGRKGVEDFIDVSASITNAKFIWAGGRPFGVLTEGVSRINARILSAINVDFTGMIELEQMKFIYAAADMLLFPSYQENCPLAPLEAAASGMPVLFRDIKEYESLYKTPYLKAKDTDGFIDMTRQLIHDRSFYNQGLKISEQLVMQFDKNAIREKLMNLYRELSAN